MGYTGTEGIRLSTKRVVHVKGYILRGYILRGIHIEREI